MFAKTRIDDAVSPVVAVILMVAVTVILAAVIGSFVLDLGSSVKANPQAGVSFDEGEIPSDDSNAQLTWDPDASGDSNDANGIEVSIQVIEMEQADSIYVTVEDDGSQYFDGTDYADYTPRFDDGAAISSSETLTSTGGEFTIEQLTPGDEITVVGVLDGKEAVLQTHTVGE